jgi:hypothetical protein
VGGAELLIANHSEDIQLGALSNCLPNYLPQAFTNSNGADTGTYIKSN